MSSDRRVPVFCQQSWRECELQVPWHRRVWAIQSQWCRDEFWPLDDDCALCTYDGPACAPAPVVVS